MNAGGDSAQRGRDGTPCRPPGERSEGAGAADDAPSTRRLADARPGRHGVPSLPGALRVPGKPVRKPLPHDPPFWVRDGAVWFVTINCLPRGKNHLANDAVGYSLLESARFYHGCGRWFVHLMLLMPDHLHALPSFPPHEEMKAAVRAWKHFNAGKLKISWQRDFFDHRLRAEETFEEKAEYILMNPVRAGLAKTSGEWPYVLAFDGRDGTPCRPPGERSEAVGGVGAATEAPAASLRSPRTARSAVPTRVDAPRADASDADGPHLR